MKCSAILAIVFLVVAASAAPSRGNRNYNKENNSNREDNSVNVNKGINQGIGSVGSTSNHGLLAGALGGGVNLLGQKSNTNNVKQSANIS